MHACPRPRGPHPAVGAVVGARARVARAAWILVEGVHDAELIEKVWGDDLRIEGVVVERLDGADNLRMVLDEFQPGPNRRVGVLLDHLVAGTKEARLARRNRAPSVLVTGTPYIDVWQAVRPEALGISEWPSVPKGVDWKTGVCAALRVDDPRASGVGSSPAVRAGADLERPLVRAVEELIDFVTADALTNPLMLGRVDEFAARRRDRAKQSWCGAKTLDRESSSKRRSRASKRSTRS